MSVTETLARLFFSRRDVVAVSAPWGKGAPCPAAAGDLLEALLAGHVSADAAPVQTVCHTSKGDREVEGLFRVGSYVPAPDGTTPWLCLDFDGAGHAGALAAPLATAVRALDAARDMDLPAYLERSGGGHGWHVWIFFEPGVLASAARKLGHLLAPKDAPLAEGGTANPESAVGIEVFPKQDKLTGKNGKGNLVWLPWWSGAQDGANEFCDDDGVPLVVESFERVSASELSAVLTATVGQCEREQPESPAGRAGEKRAPGAADNDEWRREALRCLPLEAIYGQWLTGRSSGPGWLECRDPWSPSGDKNPSSGVATGDGESERGAFHSFRSGETISVFDFLMRREGVDIKGAFELVEKWSGVARGPRELAQTPARRTENASGGSDLENGVDLRTDLANAIRFVRAFGAVVRYCPERGGWLHWDGRRWAVDVDAAVVRGFMRSCAVDLASESQSHIDAASDELKGDTTSEDRDEIKKRLSVARKLRTWARDSQQSGRVASSLKAAEEQSGIMVSAAALDADPWAMTFRNVSVDLRSGATRAHDPGQMMTMVAGCEWRESAAAPEWEKFTERVLPDATVREWLQRWAGTCMTGIISDRLIVMLVGVGANGKSVFLDALAHALGDYAASTSPEFFASAKNQSSSREYQVAQIQGARLLRAAETESGATLNESLLKQITGGDPCVGRHPYGRPFTFFPICKPVLSTNNRPSLRDTSKAVYDRLAPIDFPVRFERAEQDRGLSERLRGEAAGIAQWAYQGLRKWIADGERLTDCAAILESVSEYRRDEDPLGDFLETRTVVGEYLRVSVADLFAAYHEWAQAEKLPKPKTKVGLGKVLKSRGFAQTDPIRSVRYWNGIALLDSNGDPRMQDRLNQPEIDFDTARGKQIIYEY